jgi:hypothetical protein
VDTFSLRVDDAFLATLPPDLEDELKKDIAEYSGENSGSDCGIRMCPYCAILVAFLRNGTGDDTDKTPHVCAHCGETTPCDKLKQSVKKAKVLSDISLRYASNDDTGEQKEEEHVLQEQCIVILASAIELFFRELHGMCMDVQFVKPAFSLYATFNPGAHNDHASPGDVLDRFKSDLKMDLPEILGKDLITKLNILMLKRDAIVYKNSRADTIFLNNSGMHGKVGSRVPVSPPEISDFITTAEIIVDRIERKFSTMLSAGFHDRIKTRLARSLAILTFEMPDPSK